MSDSTFLQITKSYKYYAPPGEKCGLARISHQDHGSRRRMEPACLTRWTSPHLIFESTKHFTQSEIHSVIPLLRKILCEPKSLRDHLAPW